MTLPVPTEDTYTVAQLLTAASMNKNVRDAVNFLLNPPQAVLYQSASQGIASSGSSWTAVTFDAEVSDTYSGHSNTTNPSRYTAQVAGWYLVTGQVAYPGNSNGTRAVTIMVNGTPVANPGFETELPNNGAAALLAQVTGRVLLNVGDYVEIGALQGSGSTLSLLTGLSSMNIEYRHAA